MASVLVVAAHPDDEILGGGATFAKHVDRGDDVHALVLSEGATARYDAGMETTLRSCAERSAEIIGFSSIDFAQLPDQRLDALPLIEMTQLVEATMQRIKPTVVYTHAHVDVNSDHGVVSNVVWTACRPYSTPWLKRLFAFETPSSTEWARPMPQSAFQPQWFVEVTNTLKRKLDAMACYESEVRAPPHPRSIEALENRARYWGSVNGCFAAEPFVLLRGRS